MSYTCGAILRIRINCAEVEGDSGEARGHGALVYVDGFDMDIAAAHVTVDDDRDPFIWVNPAHPRWQGRSLDAIAAEVCEQFDAYVLALIAEEEARP